MIPCILGKFWPHFSYHLAYLPHLSPRTASEIKVKRVQGTGDTGLITEEAVRYALGIDMTSGSLAEEQADRALNAVSRKLDKSMTVEYVVNELIAEATDIKNVANMFAGKSYLIILHRQNASLLKDPRQDGAHITRQDTQYMNNAHESTAGSWLGVSTLHQVAGQLASFAATPSLRYWVVQVLHARTRNLDERLYIYSRRLLQSNTITTQFQSQPGPKLPSVFESDPRPQSCPVPRSTY